MIWFGWLTSCPMILVTAILVSVDVGYMFIILLCFHPKASNFSMMWLIGNAYFSNQKYRNREIIITSTAHSVVIICWYLELKLIYESSTSNASLTFYLV